VEILPVPPPGGPVGAASPAGPSNLRLTLTESTNPARVGERHIVYVNVQNTGQQPERQISVRVLLPQEMAADPLQIQPQGEASVRGQEIRFAVISELPSQAERQYVIPITPNRAGRVQIRAEMAAPSLAAPVVVESNSIEILPQ
jgi:hypothetical protein